MPALAGTLRCLRCLQQGHKQSFYHATARSCNNPTRAQDKQPLVPPPRQPSGPHQPPSSATRRSEKMRDYRVGDPALRPEEDRLHVPTSFELERELRDWEGYALVTWAMRVPPDTTARHLEDAIINDFRLRPEEVDVTRHRPEAFLI